MYKRRRHEVHGAAQALLPVLVFNFWTHTISTVLRPNHLLLLNH